MLTEASTPSNNEMKLTRSTMAGMARPRSLSRCSPDDSGTDMARMTARSWWTLAWATFSVAVLGWAVLGHLAAREPLQHHVDEALLLAVIVLNLPESAVLALLMTLLLWALSAVV